MASEPLSGPRDSNIVFLDRDSPIAGAPPTFGRVFTALRGLSARLLAILVRWQQRANERAHLRSLSEQALCDVGLTRADVDLEAALLGLADPRSSRTTNELAKYKTGDLPFWRDRA